jgi:hypothetical protein
VQENKNEATDVPVDAAVFLLMLAALPSRNSSSGDCNLSFGTSFEEKIPKTVFSRKATLVASSEAHVVRMVFAA